MKFSCPRCDHALEICRSFIGFSVRCPGCQHPVAVPRDGSPPSTVNPLQNEPESPPSIPAEEPDPVVSRERRGTRRLGIPVVVATAILLSGVALIVKNAGSFTTPPPQPPSSEAPLPEATPPPAEAALSTK
jgi:hypothetical protein